MSSWCRCGTKRNRESAETGEVEVVVVVAPQRKIRAEEKAVNVLMYALKWTPTQARAWMQQPELSTKRFLLDPTIAAIVEYLYKETITVDNDTIDALSAVFVRFQAPMSMTRMHFLTTKHGNRRLAIVDRLLCSILQRDSISVFEETALAFMVDSAPDLIPAVIRDTPEWMWNLSCRTLQTSPVTTLLEVAIRRRPHAVDALLEYAYDDGSGICIIPDFGVGVDPLLSIKLEAKRDRHRRFVQELEHVLGEKLAKVLVEVVKDYAIVVPSPFRPKYELDLKHVARDSSKIEYILGSKSRQSYNRIKVHRTHKPAEDTWGIAAFLDRDVAASTTAQSLLSRWSWNVDRMAGTSLHENSKHVLDNFGSELYRLFREEYIVIAGF